MSSTPAFASRTVYCVPGATSTTFKALPVDTGLTIPEVIAHHAKNSADHNIFVYADKDGISSVTFSQAYAAQLKTARIVKNAHSLASGLYKDSNERPVIGILAVAGI